MSTEPAQPALIPIPAPWLPTTRSKEAIWKRWRGAQTSCDDCVIERSGTNAPTTPLLRALWRYERSGRVMLLCSPHAARRGR